MGIGKYLEETYLVGMPHTQISCSFRNNSSNNQKDICTDYNPNKLAEMSKEKRTYYIEEKQEELKPIEPEPIQSDTPTEEIHIVKSEEQEEVDEMMKK